MNNIEDRNTLVLVGAWNPAILSPNWIAREVMGFAADRNFDVNVEFPFGKIAAGQPVRMSFEGITVLAAPDKLMFFLSDGGQVQKSIGTAAAILRLLPHTPITAFGFNFSFLAEKPSQKLLDTFGDNDSSQAFEDPDATLVTQGWKQTVKTNNHLVNVSATLNQEAVTLDINVHFEVTSATAASELLEQAELFTNVKGEVDAVTKMLNNDNGE